MRVRVDETVSNHLEGDLSGRHRLRLRRYETAEGGETASRFEFKNCAKNSPNFQSGTTHARTRCNKRHTHVRYHKTVVVASLGHYETAWAVARAAACVLARNGDRFVHRFKLQRRTPTSVKQRRESNESRLFEVASRQTEAPGRPSQRRPRSRIGC